MREGEERRGEELQEERNGGRVGKRKEKRKGKGKGGREGEGSPQMSCMRDDLGGGQKYDARWVQCILIVGSPVSLLSHSLSSPPTSCTYPSHAGIQLSKSEMKLNIRPLLRLVCQRFFGEHTSTLTHTRTHARTHTHTHTHTHTLF